jgi:hypothetical protein
MGRAFVKATLIALLSFGETRISITPGCSDALADMLWAKIGPEQNERKTRKAIDRMN